ncbi:hybrid signal transduction histidine kinase M [Artemisia annua]|uniref:Hybrid signal transduction histidine kinase M n=1 Tax=Artemisia annua TaxID=35608 RepID=A0A2U1L5T0_ARTAN|nr:hybrid signal transduction histidine kinase M [Artemisia annua]
MPTPHHLLPHLLTSLFPLALPTNLGLKSHVETADSSSEPNPEWCKLDDLIKMWILGSLCDSLQEQVVSTPGNAKALWDHIKGLFHDNKDARAIALDNELRSINIGTMSINEYCTKIKSLADRLKTLDHWHREPLPSFETTRSMLLLDESQMNEAAGAPSTFDSSSSAPTVLVTTNYSRSKGNPNTSNKSPRLSQLCNHFNKGMCKFGDRCKFIHDHRNRAGLSLRSNSGNNSNLGRMSGSQNIASHVSWAAPGTYQTRLAQQQHPQQAFVAPLCYPVTPAQPQPMVQHTTQQAPYPVQYQQPLTSNGILGPAPGYYPSQATSLPNTILGKTRDA